MTRANPGFAAIRRLVLLAAALLLLLTPRAASAAASVRVTLQPRITLGLVRGRNDTGLIAATVKTAGGAKAPDVAWASNAPDIVSVRDGRLIAHRYGRALIRAKAGNAYALCAVTVRRLPVTAVRTSRKRVRLEAGRSGFQLEVAVAPANADNPSVAWASSNPKVASVNPKTGYVTPQKPGTALIRCLAADGTRKKAYCSVVVRPVVPTGLALDQAGLQLNVGATAALKPTVSPADATDPRVVWSSSNPSVASVAGGVVTGKAYGKAVVVARTVSGGIRARCEVSVGYYTTTFRALLIGQSAYINSPMEAPATDVRLINSMLLNSDYGGGKAPTVDLRENLPAAGIRSALRELSTWKIDADDVTFFYYSGHGSATNPGALMGVDGGEVSVDDVRKYLDKLPGTVVVILDSCYSGRYIRAKSAGASPAAIDPAAVNHRVIDAFSAASDPDLTAKAPLTGSADAVARYRILTSCSYRESSYVLPDASFQGASLFTYYLALGAGVRPADWELGKLHADLNGNKIVTLNEIFRYVQPRVAANKTLRRGGVKQSVRMWPAGSAFPVAQRTP